LTLFINKKREYMAYLKVLVKVLGAFGLGTILLSCGTSPGYNYTVSGVVSGMIGSGLVLQNNNGDDLAISDNGAFSFTSTLTDGAAYSVTVKTQPTNPPQTCTVSNPSGTINSGPVNNVVVNCYMGSGPVTVDPSGKFAYVSNYKLTTGNVSAYAINLDSTSSTYDYGALILPAANVTAGTNPNPVTVDSSSQFAYVSNAGSDNIGAYTIGSNGVLSPLSPAANATVATGTFPNRVKVATIGSNQYAYVSNMGSNDIYVYAINFGVAELTDGSLRVLQSKIATSGISPTAVTIDPLVKFAYVVNMVSGTISAYTIGQSASTAPGELTAVGSPFVTGTNPVSITIYKDLSGKEYAYVANRLSGTGNIWAYTIDTDTGVLTSSTINPTTSAGNNPNPVTVYEYSSGNACAYVSNIGDGTISVYTIDSAGSLGSAATQTITAGGTSTYPNPVVVYEDLSGNAYAYVSDWGDGNIRVYDISSSDGKLSFNSSVNFGTGLTTVVIDPQYPFAYVSDVATGVVYAFTIESDGSLKPANAKPSP
jgi:6-phosphogluconolactonase